MTKFYKGQRVRHEILEYTATVARDGLNGWGEVLVIRDDGQKGSGPNNEYCVLPEYLTPIYPFAPGDKVRVVKSSKGMGCASHVDCCQKYIGKVGTFQKMDERGLCDVDVDYNYESWGCVNFHPSCLEKVEEQLSAVEEQIKLQKRYEDAAAHAAHAAAHAARAATRWFKSMEKEQEKWEKEIKVTKILFNGLMPRRVTMDKVIADVYDKTKEAVVVDKYLGAHIRSLGPVGEVLLVAHKDAFLAKARELEAKEEKESK